MDEQTTKYFLPHTVPASSICLSAGNLLGYGRMSVSEVIMGIHIIFPLQIHVERVSERGGKGWVENRGLPIFKSSGEEMVLIEPIRDGDAGYFPHLVHGIVSTSQVIPAMQLTQGQYEVTKVVAWDEQSDQM